MKTPASVRTHPLHPMLVVFPFALWSTAVIFDVLGLVTGNSTYRAVAFYDIAAGIVGAMAAMVPGFIDYVTVEGRVATIGTWHAVLNVGALLLFTASWLGRTRWGAGRISLDSWIPELLGFVGLALIIPSGWLGGSLVYKHGVAVTPAPATAVPVRRRAA